MQARIAVRGRFDGEAILDRPAEFFADEFSWIAGHGLDSEQAYIEARRIGRADSRVPRSARPAVWAVYQSYLTIRERRGFQYDWDDLGTAVVRALAVDHRPRLYKHIVIDEGQDFSPEVLKSLASAIPEEGSLTFFGDMAQQIYGQRISWRSAGLTPDRIWEFKDNYRNTRQIAALGLAITRMPYFVGTADMVEPVAPRADGPLPTLVLCASEDVELRFIAEQVRAVGSASSVAVLFRRRSEEERIKRILPLNAIRLHKSLGLWRAEAGIYYGTYHGAKGLEFDQVILPFLSSNRMPDPEDVRHFGQAEAEARDGKLLYVGVTRARRALVITFSGEMSPLLPNDSLYTRIAT